MAKRSLEEELVGVTREQAAQALATLRDLAEPEDDGPAATPRRIVGAVAAMCVRVAEVERERDGIHSALDHEVGRRIAAETRAERLAAALRGLPEKARAVACHTWSSESVRQAVEEACAAALADAPEQKPCPERERLRGVLGRLEETGLRIVMVAGARCDVPECGSCQNWGNDGCCSALKLDPYSSDKCSNWTASRLS